MSSILLALSLAVAADADPFAPLKGEWRVLAVFEDGQATTEQQIASDFFANGRISINGPTLSFQSPGAFEPRQLAFTVNPNTEPRQVDLIGASKVGTRGIYLLAGDTMMICLPVSANGTRPSDFGAGKGSGRVLMTFKRVAADEPVSVPTPPPAAEPPPPPPPRDIPVAPNNMQRMREMLLGTWGHQNDDQTVTYTLNSDGTFTHSVAWKRGLRRVFREDVRSSGTWNLADGVILATITASTDRSVRGQVYSWRVSHVGPRDLIAVDQQGRAHHEWRVR